MLPGAFSQPETCSVSPDPGSPPDYRDGSRGKHPPSACEKMETPVIDVVIWSDIV